MTDWTSGYISEVDYTYGYYQELNPKRVRPAFLYSGLWFPEIRTACELGFGQGISINVHAAASDTEWYGTDFNPAQARFCKELLSASGAKLYAYDDAFADFCNRSDLPNFDYIGLHGIWSWISDENRKVIVDFIKRKLNVGGVVYVGYNTLPGWASFAPIRHLLTEFTDTSEPKGEGIVSGINNALKFAEKFFATEPIYSKVNSQIIERFKTVSEQNRNYLAHEYFNRAPWTPMHFSTMAHWLSPAKLSYACSANYLNHVDIINLTEDQKSFLKGIFNPIFRETVRDFMVNQQFRKDYWIKGVRQLTQLEQTEALRSEKVVLVSHRQDISLKISGALGEAQMSESIYGPILDFLSDHKIRTIEEIERAVSGKKVLFGQIAQAMMILSGAGHIAFAQDNDSIISAKESCRKLNTYISEKARSRNEILHLASPVFGGGIGIDRFQQLFITCLARNISKPEDLAKSVWNTVSAQGHKLVKEGKTLETESENLTELCSQAKIFLEKTLPILRALHIV